MNLWRTERRAAAASGAAVAVRDRGQVGELGDRGSGRSVTSAEGCRLSIVNGSFKR